MSDLKLLDTYITTRGIQIEELSRASGIRPRRLKMLLAGREEFKASEMVSLCEVLGLSGAESERVFFGTGA